MHYKHSADRELQIARQTVVKDDDSRKLVRDGHIEAKVTKKYFAYRAESIQILTEFQSISDDHLGRTSVAKHCIEILGGNIQMVHSALYRAGAKTLKLKKIWEEKMWAQKIIEPP